MNVIGIDLSGPSNTKGTAMAWFSTEGSRLSAEGMVVGANDDAILTRVKKLSDSGEAVIGLDAPLSYNPGGGDRPGDADLRRRVIEKGLRPGTVMAPTMPRMSYLTLRGVCVARMLETITPRAPKIVEVHPAASMVLHGAPAQDVRELKRTTGARSRILGWLGTQGLRGIANETEAGDHQVAAYAAAFAAWKWVTGKAVWCRPSEPPAHPYFFAC